MINCKKVSRRARSNHQFKKKMILQLFSRSSNYKQRINRVKVPPLIKICKELNQKKAVPGIHGTIHTLTLVILLSLRKKICFRSVRMFWLKLLNAFCKMDGRLKKFLVSQKRSFKSFQIMKTGKKMFKY